MVGGPSAMTNPSGHAAYAVTWVAVAVAITNALPNVASRFAFVTVATAITAAVGLSRIYLRAHYLSDVVEGGGSPPRSSRCAAPPRWSSATCGTMSGRLEAPRT